MERKNLFHYTYSQSLNYKRYSSTFYPSIFLHIAENMIVKRIILFLYLQTTNNRTCSEHLYIRSHLTSNFMHRMRTCIWYKETFYCKNCTRTTTTTEQSKDNNGKRWSTKIRKNKRQNYWSYLLTDSVRYVSLLSVYGLQEIIAYCLIPVWGIYHRWNMF